MNYKYKFLAIVFYKYFKIYLSFYELLAIIWALF